MAKFDYQGALDEGYTDEEIQNYLKEKSKSSYAQPKQNGSFLENITTNAKNFFGNFSNPSGKPELVNQPIQSNKINESLLSKFPKFDYQGALDEGYTDQEIEEYLKSKEPERTNLQTAGRLAGQFALGAAENALLPYELGVAPLASQEAQNIPYRESLSNDLENLMNKKAVGQWSADDEIEYENIIKQLDDPRESLKYAKTLNVGVKDIAEKTTGIDFSPKGVSEKAANWMGFLKNPKNLANLSKSGLNTTELIKSISPSGTDFLRGVGAGTALQLAENGNFGPIGTLGSAIVGDLMGAGVAGLGKAITKPKQTISKIAAQFTPKDKLKLQKNIINDFRDAGIQADLGTITDSNLIKMTQSRLAQSSLSGKEYENLMKRTTQQIENEYKNIANQLGELKYTTNYEAGLATKEGLKSIREAELSASRRLYKEANTALKEGAKVSTDKIMNAVENIQKDLSRGALKSTEQSKVLDVLNTLKTDLNSPQGELLGSVKSLMNNKIALNDLINYEIQGGTKQLLKNIVGELDRAIISHGKENPFFAKSYVNANKRFSDYARTFRNREMTQLLKDGDPVQILNKMNSVNGIKNIETALKKSPEGRKIFNDLKRFKFDQVVGNNLIDSTTQQAKLGTFSKLLEKGKNREVVKELLGKEGYQRLVKLQKNSGRLADAVQKYYNSSKSATTAMDAAVIVQGMTAVGNALSGNAWGIVKLTGSLLGARSLNNLLSNPEFLKLVEEAIIVAEKGNKDQILKAFEKLRPYILSSMNEKDQSLPKNNMNIP